MLIINPLVRSVLCQIIKLSNMRPTFFIPCWFHLDKICQSNFSLSQWGHLFSYKGRNDFDITQHNSWVQSQMSSKLVQLLIKDLSGGPLEKLGLTPIILYHSFMLNNNGRYTYFVSLFDKIDRVLSAIWS